MAASILARQAAITERPSHFCNPCSTLTHSLPDGTQDPCGYRRNAYPRIICLSPGHAATHIMPNTLASVSVSTESVTVLALRTMVHSGLVAPLGHKTPAYACRRVLMHPVDPPDAWRGDPMRLLALISRCGSRHIHRLTEMNLYPSRFPHFQGRRDSHLRVKLASIIR